MLPIKWGESKLIQFKTVATTSKTQVDLLKNVLFRTIKLAEEKSIWTWAKNNFSRTFWSILQLVHFVRHSNKTRIVQQQLSPISALLMRHWFTNDFFKSLFKRKFELKSSKYKVFPIKKTQINTLIPILATNNSRHKALENWNLKYFPMENITVWNVNISKNCTKNIEMYISRIYL